MEKRRGVGLRAPVVAVCVGWRVQSVLHDLPRGAGGQDLAEVVECAQEFTESVSVACGGLAGMAEVWRSEGRRS